MTVERGLSVDRLAEIERLTEAATKGPWRVATNPDGTQLVEDENGTGIAYDILLSGDPEFIAACRSAVPELLAEVKRLQRLVGV